MDTLLLIITEFNKLIEHEKLEEGVSKFRNRLIGLILKTNIFEELAYGKTSYGIYISKNFICCNQRKYTGRVNVIGFVFSAIVNCNRCIGLGIE